MVSDVRVVLIKLADRLNNMRTLEHLKPDRQEAIARETLDIYAPLAHRLGMGKVRGELEDLAFRYTDPVSYEQVSAAVEARRIEGEQFLRGVEDTLVEQLRENGVQARVEWRIKRLYSIFQKIERTKVSFDQVYDLLAIRVITQDVASCYAVFGLIHTLWRPVPGRIKDFIAIPRANRYQSLHTTVMGASGHQFEVQIRTEEMHRIAEEGIAAHWKYKARRQRRDGPRRRALELDPPAGRVAKGDDGSQRIPLQPEDGPLSRRGLHLHAEGESGGGSGGRHARGLCVHDSYRSGPHLRRGQDQRAHGAAAHQAAHRRHRGDRDAEGSQAEPRLAHVCEEPARPQQDQALAKRGPASAGSGDRQKAAGARGTQIQSADDADRRPGPGPRGAGVRRGHGIGPAGDTGPGQEHRAPSAAQS
jgi:ppGpp synthetase/RelA/SpoT-type nucleotidyltranferase